MRDDVPSGWRYNPSAWKHRWPVIGLALAGGGVATYLALYQLGVVAHVWEPFFGEGSRHILKESSIAHLLPIPDAAVGAIVYLLEAAAEAIGGRTRWRTRPGAVLFAGLVAGGMGLGGIGLAVCQPALFRAFCTLCLTSATCSVLAAALTLPEVAAAVHHLRRRRAAGMSLWQALGRHDHP